jgi:hypothetical protein
VTVVSGERLCEVCGSAIPVEKAWWRLCWPCWRLERSRPGLAVEMLEKRRRITGKDLPPATLTLPARLPRGLPAPIRVDGRGNVLGPDEGPQSAA